MSSHAKLYNQAESLHNLECIANFEFMKQSPMFLKLQNKYAKKKTENKELKKSVSRLTVEMEVLKNLHFDLQRKYIELLNSKSEVLPCPTRSVYIKHEPIDLTEVVEPEETIEVVEEASVETEEETEVVEEEVVETEEDTEVVEEEEEESEEVVEAEVEAEVDAEVDAEEETEVVEEEESEEVVEEEEETEVEAEEETEVVEEEEEEESEEVIEEEESEEVVEEEEETEVVEEEESEEQEEAEVDAEVDAEEEEEGVYEITINGKPYYATNEVDGTVYEMLPNEDIGKQVGVFKNKVIQWV